MGSIDFFFQLLGLHVNYVIRSMIAWNQSVQPIIHRFTYLWVIPGITNLVNKALTETTCLKWFYRFKEGDSYVGDCPCERRPMFFKDIELEALLKRNHQWGTVLN